MLIVIVPIVAVLTVAVLPVLVTILPSRLLPFVAVLMRNVLLPFSASLLVAGWLAPASALAMGVALPGEGANVIRFETLGMRTVSQEGAPILEGSFCVEHVFTDAMMEFTEVSDDRPLYQCDVAFDARGSAGTGLARRLIEYRAVHAGGSASSRPTHVEIPARAYGILFGHETAGAAAVTGRMAPTRMLAPRTVPASAITPASSSTTMPTSATAVSATAVSATAVSATVASAATAVSATVASATVPALATVASAAIATPTMMAASVTIPMRAPLRVAARAACLMAVLESLDNACSPGALGRIQGEILEKLRTAFP